MAEKIRVNAPGLYALDPKAFGLEFLIGAPALNATIADGRAVVVDVCGPIAYSGGLLDTYAAVRARFEAACATEAQIVILRLNSPGGEVSGAFDTARALRAIAHARGKTLVAFTEAQACSAAYALACAADHIVVSASGTLGSIGVIQVLCEETRADALKGQAYAVVTSGARKADGNPHVPLSEGTLTAVQASVDVMASIFFDLVRDMRGIDAATLEAGTRIGAQAVAAGLADRVASWDELCGLVASHANLMPEATAGATLAMMAEDPKKDEGDKPEKDATRAALVKALGDTSDPKKMERARKALAAYDKDGEEAKAEDDKPDAKAEDEKKDADAKAPEDAQKAVAAALAAGGVVAELAATVQAQAAQLAALTAKSEADERNALFASRPDLTPELAATLRKLPIAAAREVLAGLPKAFVGTLPKVGAHSQGAPQALAGEGDPDLAMRMGLTETTTGIRTNASGTLLELGVTLPKAKA